MHSEFESPIGGLRHEIRIFKAVMDAGVPATYGLFNSLWVWFSDVEICAPLQVMPLSEEQRIDVSRSIIGEMNDMVAQLEAGLDGLSDEEQEEVLTSGPAATRLRALWRELAGAHAEFVNRACEAIEEDEFEDERDSVIEALMDIWNVDDEEQLRSDLRTDGGMRMFVRRWGMDPDRLFQ